MASHLIISLRASTTEAYLQRRQEIESRRGSLSRKAGRLGKMQAFLSTIHPNSLVPQGGIPGATSSLYARLIRLPGP
jgi:hypothetical protein